MDFTSAIAPAGGSAELLYTLSNGSPTASITDGSFTQDLAGAGLTLAQLPSEPPCGANSSITGTDILTLSGANLAPGETCTFSVQVTVPNDGSTSVSTTTSELTYTEGAVATAAATSATIDVSNVTFERSFDSATSGVQPGQSTVLTYALNNSGSAAITGLRFTDDLAVYGAGITVSLGANTCEFTPTVAGTVVTLSEGGLSASSSCSFEVTVQVPSSFAPGSYPGTKAVLQSGADVVMKIQPTALVRRRY